MDWEQNGYGPTGIISFSVNLAPTSQQSKRAVKDDFTNACKEAMTKFPVTLYGEVKVDIVWYIHEQDRYETDAAPDVDNILNHCSTACMGPALCSLTTARFRRSPAGGSIHPDHEQSVEIEIRHRPDDWLRRDSLSFVEFDNCLCMPLNDSAPREAIIRGKVWVFV